MKWFRKLFAQQPRQKKFALAKKQLKRLVHGYGGCVASDMITVRGLPVRYMYREKPINGVDSGWRFLSGLEDDAYMADNRNHDFYDLNTLANYDPSVLPYLESPVGSAFERPPGQERFAPVSD